MTRPIAYEPVEGYRYQLFCQEFGRNAKEHLDYAKDTEELHFLLREYRMIPYPYDITYIELPKRYWPKKGESA